MRIAVFIKATTFTKGYGGLETQNKVLCEGLAHRGHAVVVFSPVRIPKTPVTENAVRYVFVSCVYRMLFATLDADNWVNKSVQAFLIHHQEQPFDVVLSQSSAGLGVIQRKRALGITAIGIAHGTMGGEMRTILNSANRNDCAATLRSLTFGLANYFGRQRQYIYACDKIVAVSSAVKQAIVSETRISPTKVTVVHNGIDAAKIPHKNWTKPGEPFKVLYIGRIEESKGLHELLLACKDLTGVCVNIVGDGPFLEDLKRLSRQYKMSQKVLFYGRLPYDQAVEMYACNDVFVLPTKRVEGLPMTLVEACFAGLPIIATDMGGNKDAVVNTVNGYLLPKPDIRALTDSIATLAHDRKLAKHLGQGGRIKAEAEFTLAAMLDRYEQLL
jgi:glycosyltransferase involved in cell wall biosynthesis